jgi:hypothetical protein
MQQHGWITLRISSSSRAIKPMWQPWHGAAAVH